MVSSPWYYELNKVDHYSGVGPQSWWRLLSEMELWVGGLFPPPFFSRTKGSPSVHSWSVLESSVIVPLHEQKDIDTTAVVLWSSK